MSTDTGKIGKPRHRADTPLDRNVNTRLAAVELAQIKTVAQQHGLTVSAYIRLAAAGTAVLEPSARESVLTAGSAQPDPNQTAMTYTDLTYNPDAYPALEVYN